MSWIQTCQGNAFDFKDFKKYKFTRVELAHSLSQLCRFTGHTPRFYSVAEHSVRVMAHLFHTPNYSISRAQRLGAVVHDGHEAFTGDANGPLKELPMMRGYKKLCARIQAALELSLKIGELDEKERAEIHHADRVVLAVEAKVFFPEPTRPMPWYFESKKEILKGIIPCRKCLLSENVVVGTQVQERAPLGFGWDPETARRIWLQSFY